MAGGGIGADNGTWHHFTVAAPALYVKQSPANGATGLGSTVTLSWSSVPDEGYYVCWDTTDNNACDGTWWPTAAGTSRVVEGLSPGTYYWQARTAGGAVLADNGTWHHFTVAAAPGAAVSMPRGMDDRPIRQNAPLALVAAGLLALAALLASPRRRRRVVAAGVLLLLVAPAAALAQSTTQVVEYYTTDAIGSVRAVTKLVNGQWQVTRHDFMPFGEEVSPQNPPQDKRLFTGKERDTETGQDYFEARYVRPSIGRFTTPDPLLNSGHPADSQSWNRYTYTLNNPLRYTDPLGLYVWGGCSGDAEKCEAERQRFRDSVGKAQEALKNLDPRSKEGKELKRTLDRLGEEGKGRVKINFGDAGSTNGAPNAGRTVGNSITINYDAIDSVKSDFSLTAPESAALDAAVTTHEGAHAGIGPLFGFIGMRGEHAGYFTESVTYQGLHNTDRVFQLWNESWLAVDRATLEQNRERAIQIALNTPKQEKR
jgi:RHS repeat-associated protein